MPGGFRLGLVHEARILGPQAGKSLSPPVPDVPTAIAQRVPDFEIMNFMGILLHKANRAADANPAIAQKLIEAGTDPVCGRAADFNAFWQAPLALWLPLVEASGVKLN